jgi:hypothetical protein
MRACHPEKLIVIGLSPYLQTTSGAQESIPLLAGLYDNPICRTPYLSYWPARLQRLAESIPRNQILSSLVVYKYGLCLLVEL